MTEKEAAKQADMHLVGIMKLEKLLEDDDITTEIIDGKEIVYNSNTKLAKEMMIETMMKLTSELYLYENFDNYLENLKQYKNQEQIEEVRKDMELMQDMRRKMKEALIKKDYENDDSILVMLDIEGTKVLRRRR